MPEEHYLSVGATSGKQPRQTSVYSSAFVCPHVEALSCTQEAREWCAAMTRKHQQSDLTAQLHLQAGGCSAAIHTGGTS